MADKIKVALYQGFHGQGVPQDIAIQVKQAKTELLCLPEYFMVSPEEPSILPSADRHDEHLEYLQTLSRNLDCAIAGATLLRQTKDGYKNTCYLISDGKVLGYYEKIHPFKGEGKGLVKPGREYKVIRLNDIRVGLLICADVLYLSSYQKIAGLKPDLIIVPVTSPYKESEPINDKFERDSRLFVEGAKTANCPVVKVGSVGKIAGRRLQGRSLVATPDGILFRVSPEDENKPCLKIIDLSIKLA